MGIEEAQGELNGLSRGPVLSLVRGLTIAFSGILHQSLKTVLREASKFPSRKEALIKDQGRKLIDLTEDKRTHAKELFQKLEEKHKRSNKIPKPLKKETRHKTSLKFKNLKQDVNPAYLQA